MQSKSFTTIRLLIAAVLVTAVALITPTVVFGWGGWPHLNLSEDTVWSLSPEQLQAHSVAGYPYIERSPQLRPVAVLPELDDQSEWYVDALEPGSVGTEVRYNWAWVKQNSMKEDDYFLIPWGDSEAGLPDWAVDWAPTWSWPDVTEDHFWDLDGNILESVKGQFLDTYPNSWMKAKLLWGKTLAYWQAGELGNAYSYLGHVLHQLEDQGIPSHVHNDQHPAPVNDDSLEEWFKDVDRSYLLYSWVGESGRAAPPGGIMFPPSNDEVLAVALDPLKGAVAAVDADIVSPAGLSTNVPQLFYLMYTVNQYGDFSPSDEEDGDTSEPTGWCNYYDPEIRWSNDANQPLTGSGSLDTLADNDSDPDNNNNDGDFTHILKVGWRAAFRAAPALIDLFRRTVDAVPPVSTVEKTRVDGKPLSEWNNSIVNVTLASAEDGANPGYRASGVWKRWGLCDGTAPSFAPDETPYWAISGDGEHTIQLMAMDKMGNVEGPANDFTVKVDLTPPEITFPDLRPNYLTSQNFVPLWNATDATSGIDGETAYLDGSLVVKGVSINLALLAGKHRLEVYAYDKAGNYRYEFYDFEVWIDTQTDVKPVELNTKTSGESMMVMVEFPESYDVGTIDVTTCRLRVGATIDLHENDPVMGGNATILGELLTGVGDHDHDGIRDRMIKFDKEQFANAVAGKTGDINAVVWGGLLPDGTPRFIGPVTVRVFTPPK